MANAYGWRGTRDTTASRQPSPDNMGWWAGVAFLAAILIHVVAFLALGQIQIALGFKTPPEVHTTQAKIERADPIPEDYQPEVREETAQPPPKVNSLVEEIDVLSKLPEQEIDMKPQLKEAQFAMALEAPAASGAPEGAKIDPVAGINLGMNNLPEIGRTSEAPLSIAGEGQLTIDPGKALTGDDRIDKFTESIIKKGANGKTEKGTLDGVVTLDDMLGLPANVLVGKKTMLPGDLLFEYNSAELRESARVGLMKLALLVSNNPSLYCWIEGYTDLYGGDAFNMDLSLRRADAVRRYLTVTLRLPAEKIVSRGYGKTIPLVREGSADEQAPNRRVEIKMRRNAPPRQIVVAPDQLPPAPRPDSKPTDTVPPVAKVVDEMPGDPVLVKPQKAIPVEEVPMPDEQLPPPPKAKPATQPKTVHKAVPVVEDVPKRAQPVEEEPAPPKAKEIEEEAPPKAVDLGDEE